MIIVKLQGGIGNQLFQYAFGLARAERAGSALYFDRTFFRTDHGLTPRLFELERLVGRVNVATPGMLQRILRPGPIRRALYRLGLPRPEIVREGSLKYDGTVVEERSAAYYEGFWQSEKYFSTVAPQLRFRADLELNDRSERLSQEIVARPYSVSVHIRRGDYVSSAETNKLHGVCSVDYYKRAFQVMEGELGSPAYYFFSDDPEWTSQHIMPLVGDGALVHHNSGQDNWQDLVLMSRCGHHIVANSSFSWWAAWLGRSDESIVIAPARWFAAKTAYFDDTDIVPGNWIKLDNS